MSILRQDCLASVAPLGLVSPGAATNGVTPIFFLTKTDDLFSHRRLQSDEATLKKIHSGVTPWRVSPGTPPPLRRPW